MLCVGVLDDDDRHAGDCLELARRPVTLSGGVQPDHLVTCAHHAAIAVVLQRAGGEAEDSYQVLVCGGEVFVDAQRGRAVDAGVEHGHLLKSGEQFVGRWVVRAGELRGHARQPRPQAQREVHTAGRVV